MKKQIYLIIALGMLVSNTYGQNPTTAKWRKVSNQEFRIDSKKLDKNLNQFQEVKIPNLQGGKDVFVLKRVNFIADEVANQYTIQTFQGYKKEKPNTRIALNRSKNHFSAEILDNKESYSIATNKVTKNGFIHIRLIPDTQIQEPRACNTEVLDLPSNERKTFQTKDLNTRIINNVQSKKTFRIALSAAGEYSQQFGGSPYSTQNVLNALAAGLNTVNLIYKRDLGVNLLLVSDSRSVYQDPTTDPFNIDQHPALVLEDHHNYLVSTYGSASFDVGHLIVWGNRDGAGSIGSVCSSEDKGRGFSRANTSNKILWVDFVCHELGHQFGSKHNQAGASCRSAPDYRFEVGTGGSIMSYAGSSCNTGYTNESFPFFHYASINSMLTVINSTSCSTGSTGNNSNAPIITANQNITIPKQTPFILVGSGSDADGDSITYQWEQYDGNSTGVSGNPDCSSTIDPLFKFKEPTTANYRFFPELANVLAGENNSQTWEKLPCVARNMTFSLLGRDNNSDYGKIGQDQMTITVANTGPFEITSLNSGETLTGDSYQTITWDVNGTNSHCPNVDILISTDGGNSYTEVSNNVSNNGSQQIQIPNVNSTNASIVVRCHVNTPSNTRFLTQGLRMTSTFYDATNAPLIINQSGSSVPVKFGELTALIHDENKVQLKWFTITEANNSGFEIQKQILGTWKTIKFIEGKENSQTKTDYQFIDSNPLRGENFYRLKQIDFDGKFEYSNIANISVKKKQQIVYYNSLNQTIEIDSNCNVGKITVYSTSGQIILQNDVFNQNSIHLNYLSKGFYIGSFECENKIYTFKIIQ